MKVDLHMHSHASDGAFPPAYVMRLAAEAGIDYVALTDHDTVVGLPEAMDAATDLGMDFIPGVELSAMHGEREVHVLGYWIDPLDPYMSSELKAMRSERTDRVAGMVANLRDAGYDIDLDRVLARATASASRVHLGQELVDLGIARDFHDAFERFLDESSPFFVPRLRRNIRDSVKLIESAGGVAVVAHPARSGLTELIGELAEEGVIGVEAFHTDHTAAESAELVRIADELGLHVTGGSDYHGVRPQGEVIGGIDYPRELAERFLALGGM